MFLLTIFCRNRIVLEAQADASAVEVCHVHEFVIYTVSYRTSTYRFFDNSVKNQLI